MDDGDGVGIPVYARAGEVVAYAIVDKEDAAWALQFTWRRKRCAIGRTAYANRSLQRNKKQVILSMHRELMGHPEGLEVDHINGNGMDNRRSNLRICCHAQNMVNRPMSKNNKVGYKGVRWDSDRHKYRAVIRHDGKYYWLGSFRTAIEAARAYNDAALTMHGEYAHLNDVG